MQKNNVYSSATIVKGNEKDKAVKEQKLQAYQLGTFFNENTIEHQQNEQMQQVATLSDPGNPSATENMIPGSRGHDTLLNEIRNLQAQLQNIETKVSSIENEGVKGKDFDKQVVDAIKDLKHYASFFEQATFQMEGKILKTSMSIAKKIIGIELGENSAMIAKETTKNLLNKVKTASRIQIHVNPKDYLILKDQLKLDSFIELHEDVNVTLGGVVIASDLGNFDGNIEAKVNSMLESLESVI
ncbi:FliH/SctL family protein [Candidatus Marinarcus aquaticus]|uniref:Flagellar assembly protein FliH n=1 Tax=Candidatus Marinarcus aquaticus TaxID=2044504 RepID=A0A4V1LNU2_9BACT|nr:FliH/SctL family protein [Candidatus Marinarcus aquaticus]RXJ56252.1 flagellar assembly protein FliH [Candidatus Marinarcus aquaticus]